MLALLPVLVSLAVAPDAPRQIYDRTLASRLVPLLSEALAFPTVAGNTKAQADQQAWLLRVGRELGFDVRDAGMVTEVELPGPPGAPVLGLVVHGDVQPVDDHWSFPPFAGGVKDGVVRGRGAADDKGPLVQALLAMKALQESQRPRTHTIRLLVGSDEESGSHDMAAYLAGHEPPTYSLVLDSAFPVIVGEKAWNAVTVDTRLDERRRGAIKVTALRGGLAASIVPDQAIIELSDATATRPDASAPGFTLSRDARARLPKGFTLDEHVDSHDAAGSTGAGRSITYTVHGKASHAGVNPEGGRNALVALATLVGDQLPEGGARDLLAFAQLAGHDLAGTGLGLAHADPVFGLPTVVPTLIAALPDGKARLTINIRSTPILSGAALKQHLAARVAAFNAQTGAALEAGGFYGDEPLRFDPGSKLVKRLLAEYARVAGKAEPPAISGGGTYAKRLPRAIAFGMWFPGKPYPGHDVDEQVSVQELHDGAHVLIEALADLACAPPLVKPFEP